MNFTEYINRVRTDSSKWDGFEERFPGMNARGCIPMWVADTDFKAPQEVIEAIVEKAKFGIYGYPKSKSESFDKAVAAWLDKRHGWKIDEQWIVATPGVVPAITYAIQAFSEMGEGVIIQPPVYYPFKSTIIKNKRAVVENPLLFDDQAFHYEIDFADLERKVKDPNNKLLILCNPHNPIGRVWSEKDLRNIGKLCADNDVIIFSDEIHSDLIFKGYKHVPLGKLDNKVNLITAYSASKTFNLAGLKTSAVIIANEKMRNNYVEQLEINRAGSINIFGKIAMETAYTYGEQYLKELLGYVEANIDYAVEFTGKDLKGVRILKPQGTYLVWIDFRGTGLSADEIDSLVIEKAKVAADLGRWFGKEGAGFLRFNLACHRLTLERALTQLKSAIEKA